MGRRIYDDKGKFVWKYIFGRQPSEMEEATQNIEGAYYERVPQWVIYDLPEAIKGLETEINNLLEGKDLEKLRKEAIAHVLSEYYKLPLEDRENYKEVLNWLPQASSEEDFEFYGIGNFDLYSLYSDYITGEIYQSSYDTICMLQAFANHLRKCEAEGMDTVRFIDEE